MSSITYLPAPPGQDGNFFGGFGGADSYEGGVSVSPPAAAARGSSSSSSSTGVSNSVVIMVIVFSITVIVSISLCFLIRLFSGRRARRRPEADEESGGRGRAVASRRVQPVNEEHQQQQQQELEVNNALPLFTFESAKKNGGGSGGGGEEAVAESDCSICLSKFEPSDHLRLLPICCHAFHAECVDLWLESNQSCPLCRSPIFASEAEILQKVLTASSTPTLRLEVSSIPHNQPDPQPARSFSTGSHDHLIPQPAQPAARPGSGSLARAQSEDKMDHSNNTLAAERSWLRDYMERLSSRTASFRSSGRYFTGSSRRSEMTLPGDGYWDVEASRAGEEISEMFRWFSGI